MFLDTDATNQCIGRQRCKGDADPVPEHGAQTEEYTDRSGVERMANASVGPCLNQFVVLMDRQGISMKPPQVTTGGDAQHA